MRKSRPGILNPLIPIGLGVLVTSAIGFTLKNQPGFDDRPRRDRFRPTDFPKVSVELESFGTGSPDPQVWKGAPASGAWAWITIKDNGLPRRAQTRRVLGVFATLVDDRGRRWPERIVQYPQGILLTIPRGYSEVPGNLTMKVTAGGKLLATWPFPGLAKPVRELSAARRTRNDIIVKTSPVPRRERLTSMQSPNFLVELPDEVPNVELVRVSLAAHTFYRADSLQWFEIGPERRSVWVPSNVVGEGPGVQEVELVVERYRCEEVRQRITLDNAMVKRVDGQPILLPRSRQVTMAPGFEISVRAFGPRDRDNRVNRTMELVLESDTPVRNLWARVISPVPEKNGLSVFLMSNIRTRQRGPAFQNPPKLTPREGFGFQEGPFPIEFEVVASPYRLVSKERLVLPISRVDPT